ncbi:MAG: PQQ-dependent sugar dehydrogenase [Rubripirellula sp.]|nr:PQQ-dependent sugar dehydrogenase [Rubripirellula sp.]
MYIFHRDLIFAWFFLVACCCISPFQEASAEDAFQCVWTNEPIEIDGVGGEPAWRTADLVEHFLIPVGGDKRIPSTATEARLLWDRSYLYFLAEMEDEDLFADVLEHDAKTWSNDVFELFFKPHQEHQGYYEFQVNAAGTIMDLFLPNRSSGGYDALKSKDRFSIDAKVRLKGTLDNRTDRDRGWVVEGRIPWADFMRTGGRPDVDDAWGFALCRYDYTAGKEPELTSSAPLTKVDFHRVEDYATLKFVGPNGSQQVPAHTLSTNVVGSPDPPLPYVATRVWPELKLTFPIFVLAEPGSERLILIDQERSYGPARVARITDANRGAVETLFDPKGVAYSAAFHPQFTENGLFYIGSNGKGDDGKHRSRITSHQLSRQAPFELVGDSKTVIDWESNGHNGAAVTFGNDGMMYVTSGDGTSDSDNNNVGQDLTKLTAKVLRINVDDVSGDQAYSVPSDNPFVGQSNYRPETWAYGLRNPWRITVDEQTGQVWVGNNGQDMWEQVYLIQRGANYGWSVFEGSHPFYRNRKLGPTPLVQPTAEHAHSESRSLTGGVVYYGKRLPALRGAYIYGDYSTGKIWAIRHDETKVTWHREIADTPLLISAIAVDAEGELLVVDHRGDEQGGLYRLDINPRVGQANTFPTRLSETGLFDSVAQYKTQSALIPYNVNAPLWSDGAEKQRHIALPPDGKIGFGDSWGWEFPESTVLVKSFALPNESGESRWVETRLMSKQQGEWVGFSYAWNEEQTDAFLVDAKGADRVYQVAFGESETRAQTWHYPSRAECMTCHTRAANYVLGLSTLQMNLDQVNDGVVENQLARLERLGVLQVNWSGDAKAMLRSNLTQAGGESIDDYIGQLSPKPNQGQVARSVLLGKDPELFDHLVNPYDESRDLDQRARSYLHGNCAYCHIHSGGGNAQIELAFRTPAKKMNVFDVEPIHHTFGFSDAKIVATGRPEQSTLLHRMMIRDAGKMPQLGTAVVDQRAISLLSEWIQQLESPSP